MVHKTIQRTKKDTGHLSMMLFAGALCIACVLSNGVSAAGSASEPWQFLDPFSLKLSTVTSLSSSQVVVRLKPETRPASTSVGVNVTSNLQDSGVDTLLRQPAIRVPYRPSIRSPFTAPNTGGFVSL